MTEMRVSMLTREKATQCVNFQTAIADLVDQYLREGMSPVHIAEVLREEASYDLAARREELGPASEEGASK